MFRRIAAATLFLLLLCAPAAAASCFWVGGTASWDQTNTGGGGTGGIKWASASGGGTACAAVSGPAAGVPGPSDTATLDASSGGGTVTVNFGGTVTIQSLTMGAFTGTFDNSVNNNNFILSAGGNALSGSGTGTRTYKMGTATYTASNNGATITFSTATNLTYTGNTGATFAFTGTTGAQQLTGAGGLTFGTVSFAATSGSGRSLLNASASGFTVTNLGVTAPNYVVVTSGITVTVTNAVTIVGTASTPIGFATGNVGSQATLALAASSTFVWSSFRDIVFTGSPTASNSFDLGSNTGITITAPSGGGGGIIGGWLLKRDLYHDNDNTPMFLHKAA